jgi:hypothetical protein
VVSTSLVGLCDLGEILLQKGWVERRLTLSVPELHILVLITGTCFGRLTDELTFYDEGPNVFSARRKAKPPGDRWPFLLITNIRLIIWRTHRISLRLQ